MRVVWVAVGVAGCAGAPEASDTAAAAGACGALPDVGTIPTDVPSLAVTVDAPGQSSEGCFLLAFYDVTANRAPVVLFDRAGNVAWYTYGPADRLVVDVQPAADGSGDVLYDAFDPLRKADGVLARVTTEGVVTRAVPLPDGHHMFAQLPDGTLAWQALDVREATDPRTGEPAAFVGDAIVETAPDGTTATVSSTWDWLPLAENAHWDDFDIYGRGVDWTHGNALKYDAATDRYLLSLGHAAVLAEIDRTSGAPVATYAATDVAAGSRVFDYQHDTSWTDDGTLLLFATDPATARSGAIEYAVGGDGLREIWSYGFDDVEALMLGQATRLANGNTLVNFGGAGVIREVTPAGEVVWEVASETSTAKFAQMRPWPG